MCHFFVFCIMRILHAHVPKGHEVGGVDVCAPHDSGGTSALQCYNERPGIEDIAVVQRFKRQNAALPSFCCLSSRYLLALLSWRTRRQCSVHGPGLLALIAEGTWMLCVCCEWKSKSIFSLSELFLICILSQSVCRKCKSLGVSHLWETTECLQI